MGSRLSSTMRSVDTIRISVADVLQPGSRWRDCELWDGLPVVREPSGGGAEVVAANVTSPLHAHVRERGAGWVVLSSQGFLVRRSPDRLLAADGAFISNRQLDSIPTQGFVEGAPDFLIEVRSPEQTWEATVEKCGRWIAHGVRCAWAIDPQTRLVAVFRPGEAPRLAHEGDHVSAAPALPEFRLSVASLFEGLAPV